MNGWRQRQRGHGGLLVGCIRHLHKAAQHTHSLCTATHTAQADRFDIRKRSGWLAGWLVEEDDDIRTHSHHSQHRLHSLVHGGEQTASLALTRPATFSPDTRARDTGKASLACSLSRVKHVSTNIPRHADTADDSPSASTCLAHVSLHIYIQHENMAMLLP